MAGVARGQRLLSDRLMDALKKELTAMERRRPRAATVAGEDGANGETAGSSGAAAGDASGVGEADLGEGAGARRRNAASGEAVSAVLAAAAGKPREAKVRIEVISHLTRTLEKLLELRQIEALGRVRETEGDAAETERLRAEMMKRLRALDARRAEGASGLFAYATAAEPADETRTGGGAGAGEPGTDGEGRQAAAAAGEGGGGEAVSGPWAGGPS